MPIETIDFEGQTYPAFQALGGAMRWVKPFARELCRGTGVDVGAGLACLPGAEPIDPAVEGCRWDAYTFPHKQLDFVFSSHCLEHLPDWVGAVDHWVSALKPGGVLFLYLPDFSQAYWRPWNNRKHLHAFTPEVIRTFFDALPLRNVFVTGVDLNHSFAAVGERG